LNTSPATKEKLKTFHGLRHSCATLLLSKGYDIKLIQEYLGHSSVVTTGNIYAHVQFSSKTEMGSNRYVFMGHGILSLFFEKLYKVI